jgi:hypothetical protein
VHEETDKYLHRAGWYMEELEEEEDKSKATEDTEGTFSP